MGDATSICLQLRLAGAASANATRLLREGLALATKSRQVVLEESQLHLESSNPGVGVLGEDVEDQRFAVHYVAAEDLLQISLLGRSQGLVEDHNVYVERPGQVGNLFSFSRPYEQGRVDRVPFDKLLIYRIGACGVSEEGELIQGALLLRGRRAWNLDSDEEGALDCDFEIGDRRGEPATAT